MFYSRDQEWIRKYSRILEQELPEELHHQRYDGDYLRSLSVRTLCFDSVVFVYWTSADE